MKYLLPLLFLLIAGTAYATDSALIDRDGVTTSLVLGDAAAKNTGTTTGTVAAGDDGRFLKLNGVTVDSSAITTGDFLRYNGSQWAHTPLSAGDIPDLSATYSPKAGSASLTTTGTVTAGTWSGSFGAVSGANLTGLTAGNLSGTIPSGVLGNSTLYLGTTGIALNRGSGALSLTGITSIDGYAAGLAGGNGTTLLGSIPYQSGSNATTMLAPNTTSTKKFLRQTGTGTNGAAPAWDTVVKADISDLTLPTGAVVGTTDTQTLSGKTLTNPTVNGSTYGQNTASASSITLDTNAYAGATLTASGATTVTITNVAAGKYFDFKVSSSGGGAITIATLTPTWVTGTPASITAGKSSWFVCKGTGTNTADCAAVKENF